MAKTAIIIGATGLTGSTLLQDLLVDDRYDCIKLFSRSSCEITHPKIEEHLIDVFELEKHENEFTADEVFCCVGTTKAKTPDEAMYLKIDYGIPVTLARLCVKKNINTLVVISALGANKTSKLFYNRTKGRMEESVLKENIKNTYILQPSLITGDRAEKRFGEKMAKIFMSVLNPVLIGGLKKYRSIHPKSIVKAMIWLANNSYKSGRIPSDDIQKIAQDI
ncbi:MAG: NAD-dependent epimerase/dehydratase family protein [Flavobacteriales bacterium]|nr:NAD-dependent epimerase/dehydratase family protein [Flavobacteriia bacterium]NCP04832.1 NAD-dependent epimerase/dehydratase family protein [Flavobacteriales bacterium]PIV94275.1 MAG: nucleoside-diphosphate sugar epimerase [Flavobacteriaceae bacterium CG17_big_fil_post_rev_8_21_14_2_50_33_15]PIY11946.1 MAG: nucleoside-diphosphate sugar epimerase [Flavobacteriaceae bacterium CG_4_10_14_3_um_filter_33_47]PJB16234.1 MAG: nucleoside-diphosphate sugar epimerase [Flavobacteriaceae bacterium CG_4_9_